MIGLLIYIMSTVLENLLMQDSEFSESKFKSKVENEFVQIRLSMVTGNRCMMSLMLLTFH